LIHIAIYAIDGYLAPANISVADCAREIDGRGDEAGGNTDDEWILATGIVGLQNDINRAEIACCGSSNNESTGSKDSNSSKTGLT